MWILLKIFIYALTIGTSDKEMSASWSTYGKEEDMTIKAWACIGRVLGVCTLDQKNLLTLDQSTFKGSYLHNQQYFFSYICTDICAKSSLKVHWRRTRNVYKLLYRKSVTQIFSLLNNCSCTDATTVRFWSIMLLILFLKEGEQTNQLEIRKKTKTVTQELGEKELSNLQNRDLSEMFVVSARIGNNHNNLGTQQEGPLQTPVLDE